MNGWIAIALPLLAICFVQVKAYSRVSRNKAPANNVYVVTPPSTELEIGEAVDHPSRLTSYSTLDQRQVARLDAFENRQRAQDRFVPHADTESHDHAHAHGQQRLPKPAVSSPITSSSTNDDVVYAKPMVTMTFDYPPGPTSYEGKPGKAVDGLPLYPPLSTMDSFSSSSGNSDASSSLNHMEDVPTFNFDDPPKYGASFHDVPSYAGPSPHDEIIYDDHDFQYHRYHEPMPIAATSAKPETLETMDQRLNRRPYSYYYIGRKLWYVPLYFSIYFIVYIFALIVKSIARHKINFPVNLAAAAGDVARSRESAGWRDYAVGVLDAVEAYGGIFKD